MLFGALFPPIFAVVLLLPLTWLSAYQFLGGAFFELLLGGPIAMLIFGIPAWLLLHVLKASTRVAAFSGTAIGGALGFLASAAAFGGCDASPPRLIDRIVLVTLGLVVGGLTAGGAWRLAYGQALKAKPANVF